MAKERQIRIRVKQNPHTTIPVAQLQEHIKNQGYLVERIVDSSYNPEGNEAIFSFRLREGHEMQDDDGSESQAGVRR